MYGKVFWLGNFKYAMQNFKATEGVAMATKFKQKVSQNWTNYNSVQEIE